MKTRISAPAHPSATGIGRVSGLVKQIFGLNAWYLSPDKCNKGNYIITKSYLTIIYLNIYLYIYLKNISILPLAWDRSERARNRSDRAQDRLYRARLDL